jgi:hypothetical protein
MLAQPGADVRNPLGVLTKRPLPRLEVLRAGPLDHGRQAIGRNPQLVRLGAGP